MPGADTANLQTQLEALAKEIVSDLSSLEAAQRQELLGTFVSELFLAAAEQSRQETRRQKQAEAIAAAKARGVRFGRTAKPLPEKFDACYQAWRDGKLSLTEAADACGMVRSSFSRAAMRREQSADCAI